VSDVLLNGRQPEPWELEAMRRGYDHEREKDLEALRGVLAGEGTPYPPRQPSPSALVADLDIFGGQL
jgi:hypothetical protein